MLTYIIICFRNGGIVHCEMLDRSPQPSFFEGYDALYDSYAVLEGHINGGDTAPAICKRRDGTQFTPRDYDGSRD